ncbi:MAG: class I SAM-dependent methyltransferase [Acidobacteriota bacterium]
MRPLSIQPRPCSRSKVHAMATVAHHYETHLAPVYLWMAGGFEAAVARAESEIEAVLPDLSPGLTGVDLGAGFGAHTIPLARRGCSMIALDTSCLLLDELRRRAEGLPVRAVEADLFSFPRFVSSKADLILCMGDTLTHLPDRESVETLVALAAESLRPGGRFLSTFRDYTAALEGARRFVPVRSDDDRILTCFLEYAADHVEVHDLLQERQERHEGETAQWTLRVSSYRKLRLSPEWMADRLRAAGFGVRVEPGLSGMVRVLAIRS